MLDLTEKWFVEDMMRNNDHRSKTIVEWLELIKSLTVKNSTIYFIQVPMGKKYDISFFVDVATEEKIFVLFTSDSSQTGIGLDIVDISIRPEAIAKKIYELIHENDNMTLKEKEDLIMAPLESRKTQDLLWAKSFEVSFRKFINEKNIVLDETEYVSLAIDFMQAAGASNMQMVETINKMKG